MSFPRGTGSVIARRVSLWNWAGRRFTMGLNAELFLTFNDAKNKLAEWKRDHNKVPPHTSLGDIPPSEFAENWISNRRQKAEILDQAVVRLAGEVMVRMPNTNACPKTGWK